VKIWVDADACPKAAKEILYRAAERKRVLTILVANLPLKVPKSKFVQTILVPGGFDVADEKISSEANPGDLVITADIPLAAKIVEKSVMALNPRGAVYGKDNIKEMLLMRNLKEELRSSGLDTGGPSAYSNQDKQAFANQLDKILNSQY